MPQIGADRSGETAASALDKHMGGDNPFRQLIHGFGSHQGIACHYIAGDLHIPGIRGVRNDVPAVGLCILVRLADGVVIVSRHAYHLCTEGFHGFLSSLADILMHVDHALTAKALSTPRHGAAVISIRGGDHRNVFYPVGKLLGINRFKTDFGIRHIGIERLTQNMLDRIRAAQRLEAAEPKTGAFIFVIESANTDLAGETRQRMQSGGLISRPLRDGVAGKVTARNV